MYALYRKSESLMNNTKLLTTTQPSKSAILTLFLQSTTSPNVIMISIPLFIKKRDSLCPIDPLDILMYIHAHILRGFF